MKDKAAAKPEAAAKKDDEAPDSDVMTTLKALQTAIAGLTTELAAIKAGEAPRINRAGPPADVTPAPDTTPQVPEVPRVVKEIAAAMFRPQA
jgi:hypothetical protein